MTIASLVTIGLLAWLAVAAVLVFPAARFAGFNNG